MPFVIFYSWQVKTTSTYNRNFIEKCLKVAVKELKKEMKDSSPDIYIDRDTKGVPGRPNIPTTIEGKIRECDLFIGDITYVSYLDTNQPQGKRSLGDKLFGRNKWVKEGNSSANVSEELGMAIGGFRGSERVITIMNTAYGTPDQLNFDSRQAKFPATYRYNIQTSPEQLQEVQKGLVRELKKRIRRIFEEHHEREKAYFYPFVTWKTWQRTFSRPFPFETTDYQDSIFETIKQRINSPKTIFRLCGLSGIGKTRMLFECFNEQNQDHPNPLASKLLYVDVNEQDEKDVLRAIKDLHQKGESRILIVDNCSKELHVLISSIINGETSLLSTITVSTDPEERASQLDPGRATELLIVDNQSCKETVSKILSNNFRGKLDEEEQRLLVEFSSGISFVATLMADNPDRGHDQPGTLTQENVVTRLLGPLYSDDISRAVIIACSLFSKVGFSDELEHQIESIALNADLFKVNVSDKHQDDVKEWRIKKFKEICKHLEKRQLLERRGRTYVFRPSPLAVRMAEEWWRECTVAKFERILPILRDNYLVESFCEQFRYLKHVQDAQRIVKNLCDGFFSTAEVLNTSEGSRLFRSFVYVNPQASVTALITAFLPVPVEVLQSMKEGRRNLVWGLEKLCFRPETFLNATKVLAAFAVAENENIGNNATAQFLQLFHIRLPGTAASLEERWNIIEYCFGKDQNHQSIAVSALSSALSLGHFHRMGGAEDQGDVIPLEDFNPTRSEVYQYWKKVIEKLEMLAINSGPFQERAISILKEKFYGLTTSGAGKLIVPVIKKLIGSGLYDRMEARTRIQSIIKSDRVFDKSSLESLFAMLDELEPTEFSEKFKIWVESPSVDEYMDSDGSRERGKKLAGKVEALADVFFQNQDKWEVWADSFLSNHIAEGLNFGRYIAIKSDKHSAEKLVELLISKLRDAPPEKRNISILLGLTSNFPDKEFARTIFQKVVGDDKLRGISFPLFKSAQLSANEIDLLLGETEKGNFSPGMFSEFQYGWGLKHLSYEDVILIIQRLRKIDNIGKTVAFNVLATWATGDAETFAQYQNLLHEIVLQDSNVILDNVNNSMGSYIYAEVVSKLLTDNHNESLAREILTVIIKQANQFEYYFNKENEFREILSILQERYFPILWDGIRQIYMNLDEYSTVAWHFKSLLGSSHDFLNHSEGLLFGGDPEKFNIIFEWCKLHKGRELYWVAEVLPLFSKERGPDNKWHPYAMKFLDEFGQDKHVLDAIAAKLGTYSWTGSVVPKLESDKALYEQLLNHPEPVVREWATAQLADVVHRIKAERNREEDGIW